MPIAPRLALNEYDRTAGEKTRVASLGFRAGPAKKNTFIDLSRKFNERPQTLKKEVQRRIESEGHIQSAPSFEMVEKVLSDHRSHFPPPLPLTSTTKASP
jgi:hypothetical protein